MAIDANMQSGTKTASAVIMMACFHCCGSAPRARLVRASVDVAWFTFKCELILLGAVSLCRSRGRQRQKQSTHIER